MATGLYFVGEAIADQRPDPAHPRRMVVSLGGSMYFGSMGAARAIRRLNIADTQAFYVGPVSSDYFGGIFSADFNEAGVGMAYVRPSPFISMIAVVSEDGKGGNKYSFYGRNQPNTTEHLQLGDLPQHFAEKNGLFCFGSVATTLSPSGQTLRQYAEMQRKAGRIVLYDPNTRPSVIPDAGTYRTAVERWVSTASVAKASDEDVAFTYPGLSHAQVAEKWIALGAKAVFVTHGAGGCTFFDRSGGYGIPGHHDAGITRTVGAGDNFNAGILLGLRSENLFDDDALSQAKTATWHRIANAANDTAFAHLCLVNEIPVKA